MSKGVFTITSPANRLRRVFAAALVVLFLADERIAIGEYIVERSQVKKVFTASSDGHRFIAYMVDWNGNDVIVSDSLARSDFKVGEEISFLVMKHRDKDGSYANLSFALSGESAGRRSQPASAPRPKSDEQSRLMKLIQGDLSLAKNERERFYGLPRASLDAFKSGDTKTAVKLAEELLKLRTKYPDWNSGNATFHGNDVLGRVALAEGDLQEAEKRLLASAEHKGSPQLNSFGPTMTLAKGLLEKGGKAAVLQYFERCRKFWKMGRDNLDTWTADVKAGRIPDFGTSLRE